MPQNRSHAVMAQRFESRESLDDFPTPAWATRALFRHVLRWNEMAPLVAWEPACNRGHMVRVLRERFPVVLASDVADYGLAGAEVRDFLGMQPDLRRADWIITNPPFTRVAEFALTALERANCGVALFVRLQFLESIARFEALNRHNPPTFFAPFVERVPIVRGRVDPEASSATAYAWAVWIKGRFGEEPVIRFIPPCRATLERPGDYEAQQ